MMLDDIVGEVKSDDYLVKYNAIEMLAEVFTVPVARSIWMGVDLYISDGLLSTWISILEKSALIRIFGRGNEERRWSRKRPQRVCSN
jgi:hypothetical protein